MSVLRVIGIDPGIRATGWAIVDVGASEPVVNDGVIKTKASDPDSSRVAHIAARLREVVDVYKPALVAVEHQSGVWGGQQRAKRTNANARKPQLIEGVALGLGPEAVTVEPQSAKRAISSARATKDQMIRAAKRFGAEAATEHAADAVGIAFAGAVKWRKSQVSGVKK